MVLGHPGSYSEVAANQYFSGQCLSIKTVGVMSFRDVFEGVSQGKAAYGVLPIENSESGAFRSVYDLLLKHDLYIVGETDVQEEHCLCIPNGTHLEDITQVLSHPEVLEQCDEYLMQLEKKLGRNIHRMATTDTAKALHTVAEGKEASWAAIGSLQSAQGLNLKIAQNNLSNDLIMSTRYIVISKEPATIPIILSPGTVRKASICVTFRNRPGGLFKLFSCFALRDINVLKFESRPQSSRRSMFKGGNHWEYVFYLDYEPSKDETVNLLLMSNLSEYCESVRELGVYVSTSAPSASNVPEWAQALGSGNSS